MSNVGVIFRKILFAKMLYVGRKLKFSKSLLFQQKHPIFLLVFLQKNNSKSFMPGWFWEQKYFAAKMLYVGLKQKFSKLLSFFAKNSHFLPYFLTKKITHAGVVLRKSAFLRRCSISGKNQKLQNSRIKDPQNPQKICKKSLLSGKKAKKKYFWKKSWKYLFFRFLPEVEHFQKGYVTKCHLV